MAPPERFIVDNTAEDWKALHYVREWCEISSAIDIATGHFELGAFLALDGAWQKVDKIRLLIGGETSRASADAIATALDTSILNERRAGDPFLTGAEAVVDGIRPGKVEIRVYTPKKFHAKAYITHSKLKVVGSAALVGSSNFTRPGLTQNVELNVRFQGPEVTVNRPGFGGGHDLTHEGRDHASNQEVRPGDSGPCRADVRRPAR